MKLTNSDRKIVREWLELYEKTPLYPGTSKSLQRTRRWAFGETYSDIAKDENVGLGRISFSVRTIAMRIIEFSKQVEKNEKR